MSSDVLKEIIDLGNEITATRYYSIATVAVLFYDFFLTLGDEIKYAWHGKKSWVFAIFLANRYLPMGYQIWSLYTGFNTTFPQQLYGCDRTAFLEVLAYAVSTFLAQVVLTLRIYAVTRKNRIIASCFCVITMAQFIPGLYLTVYTAKRGAEPIVPIPLPVFMTCDFVGYESLEIGLLSITVVYDFLAFSIIIYLVVRDNINKVPIPRLFKTIAEDATYYFLAIFTSHFMFVMFLAFASPNIKLLPPSGTVALLPVMITRLMLSLKKAASSHEHGWSLGKPTTHTTIRFAERRGDISTGDEIRLDTFGGTHEATQVKSDGV